MEYQTNFEWILVTEFSYSLKVDWNFCRTPRGTQPFITKNTQTLIKMETDQGLPFFAFVRIYGIILLTWNGYSKKHLEDLLLKWTEQYTERNDAISDVFFCDNSFSSLLLRYYTY